MHASGHRLKVMEMEIGRTVRGCNIVFELPDCKSTGINGNVIAVHLAVRQRDWRVVISERKPCHDVWHGGRFWGWFLCLFLPAQQGPAPSGLAVLVPAPGHWIRTMPRRACGAAGWVDRVVPDNGMTPDMTSMFSLHKNRHWSQPRGK